MNKTTAVEKVNFIDSPVATGANAARYTAVTVNTAAVIKSWKLSVFSFEWLRPDGTIKALDELSDKEQKKRLGVLEKIQNGQPLEKPVLGLGLEDHIEIGSGRAEFLTLTAAGHTQIPVHIPASNATEFKNFLV